MTDDPGAERDPRAAVIVCLDFGDPAFEDGVEEVVRLVESAGVTRHQVVRGRRQRPDPALYAGSGKVEEIDAAARAINAGYVVFNHALSPAQERNLEKRLQCSVMGRAGLILEIFAQRAQTNEGKLQVELAQLEHLSTRLVRGWTHLERQRGGLGKTGGPGEKQIELDRRLIGERVKMLKRKLVELRDRRGVQRRARARRDVLAVSIVGYTNAGKSTLFNALTHARGYAADRLFATLDTTTRRVWLQELGANVTVSDTVGFVRDLPHSLVAAFRATLEETVHADLLLHVVDAASPARDAQVEEVGKVLAEIGADGVPQIMVWNKIDLLPGLAPGGEADPQQGVDRDEYGRICRVRVSARTGAGIAALRSAIAEFSAVRAAAKTPSPPETLSIH